MAHCGVKHELAFKGTPTRLSDSAVTALELKVRTGRMSSFGSVRGSVLFWLFRGGMRADAWLMSQATIEHGVHRR